MVHAQEPGTSGSYAGLSMYVSHHVITVLLGLNLHSPVAFCFYNLSSIINGLVYFDQFSMLPLSHLLLIMLGMTILLAGVWVVSFPPATESRGVDIGAWGEPDGLETPPTLDIEDHEDHYDDEPLPMDSLSCGPQKPILDEANAILASSTHTQSNTPLRCATRYPPRNNTIDLSDDLHTRHHTDPIVTSLRSGARTSLRSQASPTSVRRPMAPPQYHATTGQGHTATPSRQSYPAPHSRPLSPTTPSGFSIGLSPVSPGFALVPRDRAGRGRRVTSVEGAEEFWKGQARRVVSEGSSLDLARAAGENRQGVEAVREQRVPDEEAGLASDVPGGDNEQPGGRARARWRWVRNMVRNTLRLEQ